MLVVTVSVLQKLNKGYQSPATWFPTVIKQSELIDSESEHFCRPLIKCVLCLLITLNGNLGFFCMTEYCIADCYVRSRVTPVQVALDQLSV